MPHAEVRSGQNSLFSATFEALPRECDTISVYGGSVAGPDKTVLFTVIGVSHEVSSTDNPQDEYGNADAVVYVNAGEEDDFVCWDQREENRLEWEAFPAGSENPISWCATVGCTRMPRHGPAKLRVDRIADNVFRWAVSPTTVEDREALGEHETFYARGTVRSLKAAQMAALEAEGHS
jgi:hypothetical protein